MSLPVLSSSDAGEGIMLIIEKMLTMLGMSVELDSELPF